MKLQKVLSSSNWIPWPPLHQFAVGRPAVSAVCSYWSACMRWLHRFVYFLSIPTSFFLHVRAYVPRVSLVRCVCFFSRTFFSAVVIGPRQQRSTFFLRFITHARVVLKILNQRQRQISTATNHKTEETPEKILNQSNQAAHTFKKFQTKT